MLIRPNPLNTSNYLAPPKQDPNPSRVRLDSSSPTWSLYMDFMKEVEEGSSAVYKNSFSYTYYDMY